MKKSISYVGLVGALILAYGLDRGVNLLKETSVRTFALTSYLWVALVANLVLVAGLLGLFWLNSMRWNLYLYGLLLGVALTLLLSAGCTPSIPEPTQTQPPAATLTTMIEPTVHLESGQPADTQFLDSWSSLSPDGMWRARGEALIPAEGADQYHVELQIEKLGGDVVWSVLDEWSHFGLGYTLPTPILWSADGQYFYYTNRPIPDGCAPFVNGSDLQRVNLLDGSAVELVPSLGISLGLSPDEGTLAYFGYGGRGLVLRDIASGEERETGFLPEENAASGAIVWSPDGSTLAFTVTYDFCDPLEARTHSILRMDVETGEATTLIESSPGLYTTEGWTEAGQVWLVDQEGQYWSMDPDTGDVIPAHEPQDLTSLSLPEPELMLQVPAGYEIVRNSEEGRRGSFASYDFVGASELPHLFEIQFFSEDSIRRFTENCDAPCFFGDYPDLARYQRQAAALEKLTRYRNDMPRLGNHYSFRLGDRYYLVSNHACEGDICVIREYTTFLDEVKVDVWVLMANSSQSLQSDILFSAFRIKDES
jgi:hypothetical protein